MKMRQPVHQIVYAERKDEWNYDIRSYFMDFRCHAWLRHKPSSDTDIAISDTSSLKPRMSEMYYAAVVQILMRYSFLEGDTK